MKLTAEIARCYPNAHVTTKYDEGKSYKIVGVSEWDGNLQVQTSGNETDWWNIDQCQLILTPLDKISDEDASHCASLCGLHTAGNKVIRMIDAVFVENDTYQLQISHNGYVCLRKNNALYNADMREIYEYLKLKNYDCGYSNLNSLIAAGVAVAK